MNHESNQIFNTIFDQLGWSVARSVQTLDVPEDDLIAWRENRRRVPERIIEIMRKHEEIFNGSRRAYATESSEAPPPPPPLNEEEINERNQRQLHRDQLDTLRHAYLELADAYGALLERLPETERISAGPYVMLGLMPGATWSQVKSRYYELSRMHHPDHGGDEEIMKQLSLSYGLLRNLFNQ